MKGLAHAGCQCTPGWNQLSPRSPYLLHRCPFHSRLRDASLTGDPALSSGGRTSAGDMLAGDTCACPVRLPASARTNRRLPLAPSTLPVRSPPPPRACGAQLRVRYPCAEQPCLRGESGSEHMHRTEIMSEPQEIRTRSSGEAGPSPLMTLLTEGSRRASGLPPSRTPPLPSACPCSPHSPQLPPISRALTTCWAPLKKNLKIILTTPKYSNLSVHFHLKMATLEIEKHCGNPARELHL